MVKLQYLQESGKRMTLALKTNFSMQVVMNKCFLLTPPPLKKKLA